LSICFYIGCGEYGYSDLYAEAGNSLCSGDAAEWGKVFCLYGSGRQMEAFRHRFLSAEPSFPAECNNDVIGNIEKLYIIKHKSISFDFLINKENFEIDNANKGIIMIKKVFSIKSSQLHII
jgi:hypothetical protein